MDRRDCVKGLIGLVTTAGAAMMRIDRVAAQAAEPKKEPPMIAGPDPNTKTPTFKLPRGAVDTHTGG